ncbi:MAG: PqqD family protein [Bacteroidaceae bacterium]|nr:PqqD family protein [Bacteroidaceae bacterium]
MKIKEGFELREVCGEHVIVAIGRKNIDFCKVINFNESAPLVWKAFVDKEFETEDVVKVLLDNYEVDEQTARQDVDTLLATWKEIGLVE